MHNVHRKWRPKFIILHDERQTRKKRGEEGEGERERGRERETAFLSTH